MISEEDMQRAIQASAQFKPTILSARYLEESDCVELVMAWCTLIVARNQIRELRPISLSNMQTLSISAVGLHVDGADIDINAAGLITDISQQLKAEVAGSF